MRAQIYRSLNQTSGQLPNCLSLISSKDLQSTHFSAVGLASRGLGELMAPDGSVDEPASNNYLFQGNSPNRQQGEPVPLLYGQLRVPGRAISSDVINGIYVNPDARIDYRGNVYTVDETKYEENIGAFSG